MPFALPFSILGIGKSILDFWNKLPSPIKILIIGLIFGFVCFKVGEHKERVICQQEKQASIAEAVRIDTTAAKTAAKDAETQRDQYKQQVIDTENKLNDANAFYSKLAEKCKADAEFTDRNNAIGDSEPAQGTPAQNTRRKRP